MRWASSGGDVLGLTLLVAALALAVVAILLFAIRSRRRLSKDVREIVNALEEMRGGGRPRRVEAESGSPLAVVCDSFNRLRQDIDGRLKETENTAERLQAVMDAVKDSAVVTTDTDGDIRSFSSGAEKLFGWNESEVLTKPASMLFDESSYREFLPKLARRSLRERGIDSRATLQRSDGTSFIADLSIRMMLDAAREPLGFLVVIKDATERARLEEELRASEQRYRTLVESLAEGVLIVRGGRVIYANPAFCALCAEDAAVLQDTLLRERIATGDVLLLEERLAELETTPGSSSRLACRLLGRDGAVRAHVSLNAAAVDYEGGAAVLLVARDETAERRIEAELRRNESQLDAVIESATDGILMLAEGRDGGMVQMANRAFEDLFGLPREEILGISSGQLLNLLEERGEGGRATAALLVGEGERGRRQSLVLEGRRRREVEVSVAPLRDNRGELLGRVLVCHDLTRQRESERQLQRHAEQLQLSKLRLEKAYRQLDSANEELKARSVELDGLNQELRTLDEMKSNLLGNVSHELQTPLVSIRGYTEMILKGRLGTINEEQRKGLNLCLKNIDRLISMIDNLLAFTRAEPEMGSLTLSRFQLKPLVHEAADLLKDDMSARGVTFSSSIEPGELSVHADRDRILQVVINLLSNAVKFNRQDGKVGVSARIGKPGFVQVQVSDTGSGIPSEALGRIFERHYQVGGDPSGRRAGSGIGLAIVRDILRLHGCRIDVESKEERGSIFSFTLPLSAEGVEKTASGGRQSRPAAAEKEGGENDPPDPPRPRFRIIRPKESD
jgi:PAS domain S-box-containing protein